MTEQLKQVALDTARSLIEGRASKGQVKTVLIERYGLKPGEAGRVIRAAVHDLYHSDSDNPLYWLQQDCGESTPLQRRFARRRFRGLMDLPSSRAWRTMILARADG